MAKEKIQALFNSWKTQSEELAQSIQKITDIEPIVGKIILERDKRILLERRLQLQNCMSDILLILGELATKTELCQHESYPMRVFCMKEGKWLCQECKKEVPIVG